MIETLMKTLGNEFLADLIIRATTVKTAQDPISQLMKGQALQSNYLNQLSEKLRQSSEAINSKINPSSQMLRNHKALTDAYNQELQRLNELAQKFKQHEKLFSSGMSYNNRALNQRLQELSSIMQALVNQRSPKEADRLWNRYQELLKRYDEELKQVSKINDLLKGKDSGSASRENMGRNPAPVPTPARPDARRPVPGQPPVPPQPGVPKQVEPTPSPGDEVNPSVPEKGPPVPPPGYRRGQPRMPIIPGPPIIQT